VKDPKLLTYLSTTYTTVAAEDSIHG